MVRRVNKTQRAVGTQFAGGHMVISGTTLSAGTITVTLTGASVFTDNNSYQCTANDFTAANPVKIVKNSGSSITFTGTGTDTIIFICAGN
jgi:hypothetical protein